MAGHEAEQSLGEQSVVSVRKETGEVLEIRLPSINEDARIWRKVGEEYFKIPGVIRIAPGQEGQ